MGEKIKLARLAKGYTQEQLEVEIGYDRTIISRIENGSHECPLDALVSLKQALGMTWIPFLDHERKPFIDRLRMWNNLLDRHEFDEAKEMQVKLHDITIFPYDGDLHILYNLIYAKMLFKLRDVEPAKKILKELEPKLGFANNEHIYHYHMNQGRLFVTDKDYKSALDAYLKAFDIRRHGENHDWLYYNIAYCMLLVGLPVRAFVFLEDIYNDFSGELKIMPKSYIEVQLASAYIHSNMFDKGKKWLDKCYLDAKTANDDELIGSILRIYALLYQNTNNWEDAINYLDQALVYCKHESRQYVNILYRKARYLLALGKFSQSTSLITEGKRLSKDDESNIMLFNSLQYMMTLNDRKSRQFIETTTIPYLLKVNAIYSAFDYAEVLRLYYTKKKALKNAFVMTEIIRSIYVEMLGGGDTG